MRVFRNSARGRVGTRAYPLESEMAPAAFRGQLQLDPARCTGDAACARVCPSQAITVERTDPGWIWELNDARCVFCGHAREMRHAQQARGGSSLGDREQIDHIERSGSLIHHQHDPSHWQNLRDHGYFCQASGPATLPYPVVSEMSCNSPSSTLTVTWNGWQHTWQSSM